MELSDARNDKQLNRLSAALKGRGNATGDELSWYERERERERVLGSIPDQGGDKNLYGIREPSDYISFREAVKRNRFHVLKH